MATTLRKCRFIAAAAGLNDFVVSAAVPGFLLPVTAHAENLTYNYTAFFGDAFESGDGTYSINTATLTRDIVLASSNSDQFVDFSDPPTVIMTYATEQPPQPGRLLKSTLFTSSSTWNKDPKTKTALMIATAGGAGGGSNNGGEGGSGGGAGATVISLIDVSLISGLPITIGAAGAAAAASSTANGGAGGDTIIGSNIVVAKGGSNGSSGRAGGLGGAAASCVGDIKISGGPGGNVGGTFGDGGGSFWGGGGKAGLIAPGPNATPGVSYGAGGGGSGGNGNAGSGGVPAAGAPGVVWILEFS